MSSSGGIRKRASTRYRQHLRRENLVPELNATQTKTHPTPAVTVKGAGVSNTVTIQYNANRCREDSAQSADTNRPDNFTRASTAESSVGCLDGRNDGLQDGSEDTPTERTLHPGKKTENVDLESFNMPLEQQHMEHVEDPPSVAETHSLESSLDTSERCESSMSCEWQESSDEEEEEDHLKAGSAPIYEGTGLNIAISMLLILTFVNKHDLTGEGLVELLELIHLHCMADCILPKTLYKFRAWFGNLHHALVFHRYCVNCSLPINAGQRICSNEHCNSEVSKPENCQYFIENPLDSQLKSMFKRDGFFESLQHRFTRQKKHPDAFEDIYDGSIYKGLSGNDVLGNKHNISFTWNTDGIPVFRSSRMSMWPIFLMINELPYKLRQKTDNMLMAELWFGKGKPMMMSYFKPFHTSLCNLENEGVEIDVNGKVFTSKCFLICGTCDLPARACMCNMNQYNGHSSCLKCEQPGNTCKAGKGNVHVFPPQENIFGPFRNDDDVRECGAQAGNKQVIRGIKGPSLLSYFKYYSFVRCTGIDYMHGILLGAVKLLATLWFSSEKSSEIYSLSKYITLVDKQLEEIKPPNNVSRVPRSLSDHKQYWKASEWRNWLLYYSVPILKDIWVQDYFEHYLLLVQATYIMLQDSILPSDLDLCEQMLVRFVVMFPALYEDRYLTLNIHQLLHLPQCVRDLGPLWCFSCFPFEDANGKLMKMFHGTQHVDRQIVNAISTLQKIPEIYYMNMPTNPDALEYYSKLTGLDSARNRDVSLGESFYNLGATSVIDVLSCECLEAVCDTVGYMPAKLLQFNRIRKGNDIYHSKLYSRVKRRNSYTVMYRHGERVAYGLVCYYLQSVPQCSNVVRCQLSCCCPVHNLAVLEKLVVCEDQFCVPSHAVTLVKKDAGSSPMCAVPLTALITKCVFVDLNDSPNMYICKIPNLLERD